MGRVSHVSEQGQVGRSAISSAASMLRGSLNQAAVQMPISKER